MFSATADYDTSTIVRVRGGGHWTLPNVVSDGVLIESYGATCKSRELVWFHDIYIKVKIEEEYPRCHLEALEVTLLIVGFG